MKDNINKYDQESIIEKQIRTYKKQKSTHEFIKFLIIILFIFLLFLAVIPFFNIHLPILLIIGILLMICVGIAFAVVNLIL